MNIKRFVVIGVASIALMGAKNSDFTIQKKGTQHSEQNKEKEKLFDLDLLDLNNKNVILLDYAGKGKTTVLTFFSETCLPCREEIAVYNEKYDQWLKDFNAEIIVVNIDAKDKMLKFKEDFEQNNYKFKAFWDKRREAQGVLKIKEMPLTLIVDKEGYIVEKHIGFKKDRDIPRIEKKLDELR